MSQVDDAAPPRRHVQQKQESFVGNMLEGLLTYGVPVLYSVYVYVWIVGGPDAASEAEYNGAFRTFLFVTFTCLILYSIGCAIGTAARFSNNPLRLFVAGAAALTPLLIGALLRERVAGGAYQLTAFDLEFAFYTMLTTPVFAAIFVIMYTAIRRVHELSRDA